MSVSAVKLCVALCGLCRASATLSPHQSINQSTNQSANPSTRGRIVPVKSSTSNIPSVRAVRARLLMPLHSHNRRAIGQQWRSPHTRQQRRHPPQKNKKLSCRRVTARCFLSVVILPITTQQCRNYLYDKSWPNRWYEVGGLVRGNVS